jgi:hypothetical protein
MLRIELIENIAPLVLATNQAKLKKVQKAAKTARRLSRPERTQILLPRESRKALERRMVPARRCFQPCRQSSPNQETSRWRSSDELLHNMQFLHRSWPRH